MKKILLPFIMLVVVGGLWAGDRSKPKIQGVTQLSCVDVSTSAWTAIPSTTTIKSGRGGMVVFAPRSTAGAFNLVYTSYTVQTPSVAISSAAFDMVAGDNKDLDVSEFVFLHAVSTHSAKQTFCFQEYTFDKDR